MHDFHLWTLDCVALQSRPLGHAVPVTSGSIYNHTINRYGVRVYYTNFWVVYHNGFSHLKVSWNRAPPKSYKSCIHIKKNRIYHKVNHFKSCITVLLDKFFTSAPSMATRLLSKASQCASLGCSRCSWRRRCGRLLRRTRWAPISWVLSCIQDIIYVSYCLIYIYIYSKLLLYIYTVNYYYIYVYYVTSSTAQGGGGSFRIGNL